MAERIRNVAAAVFLVVAFTVTSGVLRANPFSGVCSSVQSYCFDWDNDFQGCTEECSDLFQECVNWCAGVNVTPRSWSCSPASGTPTSGHCYCWGEPCN